MVAVSTDRILHTISGLRTWYIYTYIYIYIYISSFNNAHLQLCVSSTPQAGKYNHGKFAADGTTHSIPTPLAHAFEQLMLGRQMLGEENDSIFARNTFESMIEIWNTNIKQLRKDFTAAMGGKALSSLDKKKWRTKWWSTRSHVIGHPGSNERYTGWNEDNCDRSDSRCFEVSWCYLYMKNDFG